MGACYNLTSTHLVPFCQLLTLQARVVHWLLPVGMCFQAESWTSACVLWWGEGERRSFCVAHLLILHLKTRELRPPRCSKHWDEVSGPKGGRLGLLKAFRIDKVAFQRYIWTHLWNSVCLCLCSRCLGWVAVVTVLSCGNEEPGATHTLPEAARASPGWRRLSLASGWPVQPVPPQDCVTPVQLGLRQLPRPEWAPATLPVLAVLPWSRPAVWDNVNIPVSACSPPADFSSGPREKFPPISWELTWESWDPTWSPVSRSGALSTGRIWTCWSGARGGPQRWSGGWSTSAMRKGWGSWGCSAWRREGCGESLLWPFSTWRGLIGKKGKIFLIRPVVTGQGVLVLNSGRVDLDWTEEEIVYYEGAETLEQVAQRWQMPQTWKHSRPGWTGLWATWSSWRCPCSLPGDWARWPLKD